MHDKPLTARELTAAVDAVRTAVATLAAVARDRAVDLPDLLAGARQAHPGEGDATALVRRLTAHLRDAARTIGEDVGHAAGRVAGAVADAHDRLARTVNANPARDPQDFAPAGFVALSRAAWGFERVELPGGSHDTYAVVPATVPNPAGGVRDQLPPLLPPEKLFRRRLYVVGPMAVGFGGRLPAYFAIEEIRAQTARLIALDAARRAEDDTRQRRRDEEDRQRQEAARLARPLTVADLERLRAETAVREPA